MKVPVCATADEMENVSNFQFIDDSLEHIFISMMDQGEVLEAIDFLRSIESVYIPTQHIIQALIFQILMKSDDVRCLSKASAYLTSVINVYPPDSEDARNFYLSSIVESQGCENLWELFCLIVNSYFIHHEIYVTVGKSPDALKYPNCKILLEFYIYLFSKDLEHMTPQNFKSCLIVNLLWPGGNACLTSRTESVLKWIDGVYSNPSSINQWAHLQKNMHELLTLMVKYMIHGQQNLVEASAFNDPILADISEAVANFCKNAFSNLLTLKMFLSSLSLKCLRAKVCDKIIRLITKESLRSNTVLTLKEIVNQHLFPHKFNKWKSKTTSCKEKNLRRRPSEKPIDKSKLESTKLHQFCEENKVAELAESLKTLQEHINTRDTSGCTPLFKACQRSNYTCVATLLNESGKAPKVDATIGNFDGITPLHLAVTSNSLLLAKILLDYGGSDLLYVADNKDQRPTDLDCSEEMEKLIKQYQSADSRELNSFIEDSQDKEAPTLKSFKEYGIYLHTLNCLLCSYADLFQLHDLVWKKGTCVQNHNEKMCAHYINDNFACSEDAALLPELPELLDTFIQSLCRNKSKLAINIDLELLPLKAFKASIQSL